jgi:hypothetical protein
MAAAISFSIDLANEQTGQHASEERLGRDRGLVQGSNP